MRNFEQDGEYEVWTLENARHFSYYKMLQNEEYYTFIEHFLSHHYNLIFVYQSSTEKT